MYCRNCGKEIPEGNNFCTNCGIKVEETTTPVDIQREDNYYEQPYQQQTVSQPGMKWFKFIIYFQLILASFSQISSGLLALTGLSYDMAGGNSATVYSMYPVLRGVDMWYGVVCIGMAFAAVYVRQSLAKFKVGAPNKYLMFLALNFAFSVAYILAANVVTGQFSLDFNAMFSSLSSVVMLVLNGIYFRKREYMFVN